MGGSVEMDLIFRKSILNGEEEKLIFANRLTFITYVHSLENDKTILAVRIESIL